jgi:hypothetical protein
MKHITSNPTVKEKAEKEMNKQTYFLGLPFNPEDGGSMFFRNIVDFLRTACYILEYRTPHIRY